MKKSISEQARARSKKAVPPRLRRERKTSWFEIEKGNKMTTYEGREQTVEMSVEEWLAVRKEAGLKIDPETAEVEWCYAQTLDPYGVYPNLPEEYRQVGREYFARSPESDIWVEFGDLPEATRNALWTRHESKLVFPAGLPLRR